MEWRPTQGSAEGDWRAQIQHGARGRIVDKIMETLKKHMSVIGSEELRALRGIAERFEEKMYNAATDQPNYLRMISLKMLSMDTKAQQAAGNAQVIPNRNNLGQANCSVIQVLTVKARRTIPLHHFIPLSHCGPTVFPWHLISSYGEGNIRWCGEKKGKTILGKRCKRITDFLEEKYNSLPSVPHEETSTEQVLKASRLNSPSPTLEAPGLGHGDYDRDRGDNYKHPEASPVKKAKHSKGSDEGKPKEGKDVAINNPIAARKEELETYKDVKTKQTESYRDMKMAQMEENDPDKDPYCIGYCIDKLKSVGGLTAIEQLKMIDYLKDKRADREIFMKVEHDVVVEMYKEVIGRQV